MTDERWSHIVEEHNEIAGLRYEILETITAPERVLEGTGGEHLAVREYEPGKWLVAVYREFEDDGFIITAFWTRRRASLDRRVQLWP
ncbi:MAG: hypothetical protein O3A47_13020 [Chloroflexi bacterium]|nr:hypothetical protein [Chloroflexota bacterium]